MDGEKKIFGGWWLWVLLLVVISVVALGVLGSGMRIFGVAVEREIFEQSYQRSAAETARLNILNAELVGARSRLQQGSLTATQEADLRAQIAGLEAQIRATSE